MITQTEPQTRRERWLTTGEKLLATTKKLIHEGNVRRIIVAQDGNTIAEFPLTAGVVGVVLAPTLAAIGALSALLINCTIEIERTTLIELNEPVPTEEPV